MQRRFQVWALIVGSLLGGASLFGVFVKAVIAPRPYNYTKQWATVSGAVGAVRQDLALARLPEFGPFRPPDPADAAAFQFILDGIGNPDGFRRSWEVLQHFSFDRMAEELARIGVYAAVGKTPTNKSIMDDTVTFQNAVSGQLGRPGGPFTWERSQVLRVATSTAGNEAVVLARHVTKSGGAEFVHYRRWWLRNDIGRSTNVGWQQAGWHVYDFDEPGSRLRYTVTQGGVLADGSVLNQKVPGVGPTVFLNTESGLLLVQTGGRDDEGVVDIRDALAAAADGDRSAAAAKVAAARRWRMIPALSAVREVAEGRLLALDGRPADALRRFDAALRNWPDTPAAQLGRAVALNDLKKHTEALASLNTFRTSVGHDPEAFREEARAKAGLASPEAAVDVLRAGLKEFPGAVGLLVEWFRLSPPGQRAEAGEWAANAQDPGAALTKLLRRIETNDPNGAGAAAVVSGYQRIRPREAIGLVAQAAVRVRQGQPVDAAGSLQAGLAGLDDDGHRLKAIEEFARTAALANRATDGYEAAARAGQADRVFRLLAEAVLAAGHGASVGGLAAVIETHGGKHPNDPWPHYYRAALRRLAGDHAAAERQLAEGMKKLALPSPRSTRLDPGVMAEDLNDRERDWSKFRTARGSGLYKLGKWRQAYDELTPKVDTFDQLARLFADDKNADGLLALIAAHQAAVPGDSEVLIWRTEAHFLKKDYPAVLTSAIEYGQKNPEALVPTRLADRWVRSLIRLGRPVEAVTMTEAVAADAGGVMLRALAAAANQDVSGTLAQFRDLRRAGGSPADAYADPDLGPLLRGPAFSELRKAFPPPKTK